MGSRTQPDYSASNWDCLRGDRDCLSKAEDLEQKVWCTHSQLVIIRQFF